MSDVDRLDVDVEVAPEPGLLRPAIEAAVAGRYTAPGPESVVAAAVATAVGGRSPRAPQASQGSQGGAG